MRQLLVSVLVLSFAFFSTLMVGSSSVFAGEHHLKTVLLKVDDMTCNMCPITVKKALRKVVGVKDVSAKYEGGGEGWAKVTYDPKLVDVDTLTLTTTEAGYPSHLKKQW